MGIAEPHAAAMKTIVQIVTREASMISFNDVYLAMAATFVVALLLLPLAKPARHAAGAEGAH